MSEKVKLEPQQIGGFLNFMGGIFATRAHQARIKTKDSAPDFEAAIVLGFLLALRQPELFDACIMSRNLMSGKTADDYLDFSLTLYQQFLRDSR